jgi:hypothetical protein
LSGPLRIPASLCVTFAVAAAPAFPQIIGIGGGTSTLFNAQGGAVTYQSQNTRIAAGAGVLDGSVAYGASLGFKWRDYEIFAGDNPIPVNLPTDIFDNVQYFVSRGVGVSTIKKGWHITAFAGATAEGLSTPLFPASETDTGVGLIYLDRPLSERFHFYSLNIFSQLQTSIQGAEWKLRDGMTLDGAAGVGSNQPYAGTGLTIKRRRLWARIGYVYEGDRFRRVTVQSPINAEVNGANVLVVANPVESITLTAGHEELLQPQQNPNLRFLRATVNHVQGSGEFAGFQLGAGLFQSQQSLDSLQAPTSNVGEILWASRRVSSWLETGGQYYRNQPSFGSATSMLTGRFREILSPRLTVLELVNYSNHQTTLGFGGSFQSNLLSFDVDYSTIYIPFGRARFEQALGFTVSLRLLGHATLSAQSYVTSDGQTKYSVAASTAFYRGLPFPNHAAASSQLYHYAVRGRVVDDAGHPIEGAAVRLDKELLITDSSGEFVLRTKHATSLHCEVVFSEFTNPAQFETLSVPVMVQSTREDKPAVASIVLKRR